MRTGGGTEELSRKSAKSPQAKTRQPRRRLTTADYQAVRAFRHTLRRFLAFSESAVRIRGLTPQQHQALLAIRGHPGPEPITVGELADCLLIKNHSAVGLVSRLAERDLVIREISNVDRRRVVLTLTPAALGQLEEITRQHLGELGRTADTFRELLEILQRLDVDGALDQASIPPLGPSPPA